MAYALSGGSTAGAVGDGEGSVVGVAVGGTGVEVGGSTGVEVGVHVGVVSEAAIGVGIAVAAHGVGGGTVGGGVGNSVQAAKRSMPGTVDRASQVRCLVPRLANTIHQLHQIRVFLHVHALRSPSRIVPTREPVCQTTAQLHQMILAMEPD